MKDFYLLNVSAVDTRKALVRQFASMRFARELFIFVADTGF